MNEMSTDGLRGDVPFAVTTADRVPAKRYYDPGFHELELTCRRIKYADIMLQEILAFFLPSIVHSIMGGRM